MYQPRIGLRMEYFPDLWSGGEGLTADIVSVEPNGTVTLTAWHATGVQISPAPTGIRIVQPGTARPTGGAFCMFAPTTLALLKLAPELQETRAGNGQQRTTTTTGLTTTGLTTTGTAQRGRPRKDTTLTPGAGPTGAPRKRNRNRSKAAQMAAAGQ